MCGAVKLSGRVITGAFFATDTAGASTQRWPRAKACLRTGTCAAAKCTSFVCGAVLGKPIFLVLAAGAANFCAQ